MTYDELVEKVARAICSTGYGELLYDVTSKERQDILKEQAKAAIDTIREALMEPTPAMEVAVSKNWGRRTWSEYRDVLAASPLGEKKG